MRGSLLATLALGGCGKTCTLMFYVCSLTVSFADGGLSAAGEWTVTADFDGETITCSAALPAEPSALIPCDSDAARLVVSEDGSAIERLDLDSVHPDELAVTVGFDGEEIHSEIFAPEYAVSEPNGEGCGECHQATVEASVPPPD